MTGADELAILDARGQAELIRRGEVTALELVEAAINRIEQVNPLLNAVITPLYDSALEAARKTIPDGPFRGVPFVLKDLQAAMQGVPLSAGSKFLQGFVPGHDSELVTRYRRAGLIIVGKTNTPEFGILPTTEPVAFGATRNPWNTGRATGGSSGGSAAAVASGMVPMGHANDGGGSIRIPASCCGLFGLKPTRGRNSLAPDFGDVMSGLVVEHAVTRSVRDSAILLDATAGPVPGDPYWAPPKQRPFSDEVGADPGKLKIAFSREAPTGVPIHADCAEAVTEAARLCADLGHHVEEAGPRLDGEQVTESFVTIWESGVAWVINALAAASNRPISPKSLEPLTYGLMQRGARTSAPDYLTAVWRAQMISRMVAMFFESYDLWLTPTLAEPPLPLGSFDSTPDNPVAGLFRAAAFVPFTPIFNVTGQPAMSVPLFWNNEGLPIGVHFAARFGDEAALFRLASQLESARPWASRRPAVFAAG